MNLAGAVGVHGQGTAAALARLDSGSAPVCRLARSPCAGVGSVRPQSPEAFPVRQCGTQCGTLRHTRPVMVGLRGYARNINGALAACINYPRFKSDALEIVIAVHVVRGGPNAPSFVVVSQVASTSRTLNHSRLHYRKLDNLVSCL